jgi:lipoprotein-releasing system permease protein
LNVNISDAFEPLKIYSPKKSITGNSLIPLSDFIIEDIQVAGVFEIQQEFDQNLIVPLNFARILFEEPVKVSAIELNFKPGVNIVKEKKVLENLLGSAFELRDRMEQNQALYKVLFSEKWMIYLILSFIVIIAIFNIIGSLTMLVIEKLKDISVLSSLGAGKKLIKRIFLYEGLMISMFGCIIGLTIGLIFCLIQQYYGFIKMGEQSLVFNNAYPIAIKWQDFILVFITVAVFSIFASTLASNLSVKKIDKLNQDL